MNLGVVTHIEAVKHLNVPTISTACHSAAFIEDLHEVIHHYVTNLLGLVFVLF